MSYDKSKFTSMFQEEVNKKGGSDYTKILDLSKIKGEVSFYQPKTKGKNIIDILPFTFGTSLFSFDNKQKGEVFYKVDYSKHRNIGEISTSCFCLRSIGKKCPICEEFSKADTEEEKKALKPSKRVMYNIIDLKEPDKGIQIFDTSFYLFDVEFRKALDQMKEEIGNICPPDLENGTNITFYAEETKMGSAKWLAYSNFAFPERGKQYSLKKLDEVYSLDSLLIIPTYDEVAKLYFNTNEEETTEQKKVDESKEKEEETRIRKPKNTPINPTEEIEAPLPRERKRSEKEESTCPVGKENFGTKNGELPQCDTCIDEIYWKCHDEKEKSF